MRSYAELQSMGADTAPLYSDVDELEAAYEELSANVNSIWGPKNSYAAFCKAREIDFDGHPDYKHRELSELGIPQPDFHRELLRSIRRTQLLILKYPAYGPEIKLHLSRWTQILIEVMAAAYEEVLTDGEPIKKSERSVYNYAFDKLKSAISFYRFLNQRDQHVPMDPSIRWKLPRWIEQLVEKQHREGLASLLRDARLFAPTDVDALLIHLGVIDEKTRKWIKTQPGKGGNQSAFPAAYAALIKREKMFEVKHTEWASIFKKEYKADFSGSTAEKAAGLTANGKSRASIDQYYKQALNWIDTDPSERGNL